MRAKSTYALKLSAPKSIIVTHRTEFIAVELRADHRVSLVALSKTAAQHTSILIVTLQLSYYGVSLPTSAEFGQVRGEPRLSKMPCSVSSARRTEPYRQIAVKTLLTAQRISKTVSCRRIENS
jgi:hypothetical protein